MAEFAATPGTVRVPTGTLDIIVTYPGDCMKLMSLPVRWEPLCITTGRVTVVDDPCGHAGSWFTCVQCQQRRCWCHGQADSPVCDSCWTPPEEA